jgi:hypothetical protein
MTRTACIILALLTGGSALAGSPEIVDVKVQKADMGWRFEVTLRHPDTGWDHYASGWEIRDASGNRLDWRELHHPHVAEQPFTRSLASVMLPDGTTEVFIRARCSLAGWSGPQTRVEIGY